MKTSSRKNSRACWAAAVPDPGRLLASSLLACLAAGAGAAELLEFEFERKGSRYMARSESYVDVPPEGVFFVLTDYDRLHRISNLVTESRELEPGPDGARRVFTTNSGCVAFFCRTVKKVERLEAQPSSRITTIVISEESDVAYSVSTWVLEREGRGTHLSYRVETDINFWVPPLIGNLLLRNWLHKGAKNALIRVEYYAWHYLYGDYENPEAAAADDKEH